MFRPIVVVSLLYVYAIVSCDLRMAMFSKYVFQLVKKQTTTIVIERNFMSILLSLH